MFWPAGHNMVNQNTRHAWYLKFTRDMASCNGCIRRMSHNLSKDHFVILPRYENCTPRQLRQSLSLQGLLLQLVLQLVLLVVLHDCMTV